MEIFSIGILLFCRPIHIGLTRIMMGSGVRVDLARIGMGKASAILASYLYEREDILLQIPGDVPLDVARQYEAALMAAK